MEAFEVGPEFGLGTGASGGIDGQRQFQQRIAAVLEVVVGQRLDSGQRFEDADDGRFVEAEEVLAVDELREEAYQSLRPPQLLDGAEHLLPHALTRPVLKIEILELALGFVDGDGEVGTPVDLFDGAGVAAAFVDHAGAPVEADDLVADGVDVVGRVEGGQLMRKDLPHRQERQ